ncbi:hypothetical protein GH808_11335 [Acetobacterium fimetarium]|uniref:Methyltransferase domain-containing protein n=1 Tax=Acetobacterium fimetarium TaxID=52691 RepID=A0ABR6WWL3_9FIRM|nr:hypothetical protein [Acetobacterium fimetarium]MBC3805024.1 hypothetical protein [Acetobacterium fimetarium]
MDYPIDYFDGIIDSATIYSNTYSAIVEMYDRCYNVLKKNGGLFTSCFTKYTDGFGTGTQIEDNTYRDLIKGRLSGRGIVHFFTDKELFDVLTKCGFINIHIDTMTYTDNGTKVEMLLAQAEK